MLVKTVLTDLLQGATLNQQTAKALFDSLFDGGILPSQIAAILTVLASRGATPDEISGAVSALQHRMTPVITALPVIDCCGTGGDQSGTFNISTAVSFVVAACNIPVAKHGNRSASSLCGAADVLEECGIKLDLNPARLAGALDECNITFLFAPNHHPVLRQVAPIRQELGFRTIFNLLGPLLNPCRPSRQLIGVYDKSVMSLMAEAARQCGLQKAWIIHGAGGVDEITLHDESHICMMQGDAPLQYRSVMASDFGLPAVNPAYLEGGKADVNAAALLGLLRGQQDSYALQAYRATVLANAACVLAVAYEDPNPNLTILAEKAAHTIDSGAALAVFDKYLAFTNGKKIEGNRDE